MSGKRWCLTCAALLAALIVSVIGLVALVDPFEIYHRAWFYDPPYDSAVQMYSNAGIARSYAYDGVIVGSSVTENCLPSDFDAALGGRFVKLCMNGGTSRDHAKMLAMAFDARDVRRVVYGLDLFAFWQPYTIQRAPTPDALYDGNPLNDASYWFNKSVLFTYIPQALSRIGPRNEQSRDWMYVWDAETYDADALFSLVDLASPPPEQTDAQETVRLARENVAENLLPFIRAHRETTFFIFFPPYSLLYWADLAQQGRFEACLLQKAEIASMLIGEPNVRLFDYQMATAWVVDFSLYSDLIHYHSSVNRALPRCMAADEGRISSPAQIDAGTGALREAVYALFEQEAAARETE